jgi:hypothetical protein
MPITNTTILICDKCGRQNHYDTSRTQACNCKATIETLLSISGFTWQDGKLYCKECIESASRNPADKPAASNAAALAC